jgi:hypothetical protein
MLLCLVLHFLIVMLSVNMLGVFMLNVVIMSVMSLFKPANLLVYGRKLCIKKFYEIRLWGQYNEIFLSLTL